jgi:transcription termination/antitermination protein NusA
MVVTELRGEKIDIVPFSEDLPDFVAKALSPAKVNSVTISADGTAADVIVPDHQLSLAIGREGQNARLAARLTGVRVDIRSETQVAEGVPAGGYLEEEQVEYAEGEWRENPETGEMEWHAADGSVISQSEWAEQAEVAVDAGTEVEDADETASDAEPTAATPTDAADDETATGASDDETATGASDDETATGASDDETATGASDDETATGASDDETATGGSADDETEGDGEDGTAG